MGLVVPEFAGWLARLDSSRMVFPVALEASRPSSGPSLKRGGHLVAPPHIDFPQLLRISCHTDRRRPRSSHRHRPPKAMDVKMSGVEIPLLSALQRHLMGIPDGDETDRAAFTNAGPTHTYFRDARAMAATPADVEEHPNSYAFVVDMPGLKSGEIKVQVEDGNVLVISGERKREEKEGGRYLRMERRVGKFMRKFSLPDNADTDAVSAVCRDGVLTVTVKKLPPPEPKKPKTVEVKVA